MDKLLPVDLDVERLVLGATIIGAAFMDDIRGVVEKSDFSVERHRLIWSSMCSLYDTGQKFDRVTLRGELERIGKLKEVNSDYLLDLDEGLPHFPSISQYVARLKEKATLRRIMEIADLVTKQCAAGVDNSEDILNGISSALLELGDSKAPDKRIISTREMIDAEGIEALLKPRHAEGMRLPWEQLNGALCGLHPGQMVVLAADTGRGKTSMALQIATHVTRQGMSPVVWTLEMSPKQNFTRMVNQMAGSDGDRSRHGLLTDTEVSRRKESAYWLHGHPVWFDRHSRTVASFCASVRQAKAKSDIGLVVVDYLQLIKGSGRAESRTREVGENSRALKLAAMDLNLPFLVLSQFRRTNGEEPTIHSLKESGDIENDSDVVLLLNSPKELGGNEHIPVSVKVGKNREGPAGFSVPLIFNPTCQTFYSSEEA